MIGLDTNILVRLIVDDDAAQTRAATRLMLSGECFVSTSVLMETEWVLRSVFNLGRDRIADALERICGIRTVRVDRPEDVRHLLELFKHGFDFADAVHVVAAANAGADAFATFDQKLRRKIKDRPGLPVARTPG